MKRDLLSIRCRKRVGGLISGDLCRVAAVPERYCPDVRLERPTLKHYSFTVWNKNGGLIEWPFRDPAKVSSVRIDHSKEDTSAAQGREDD
jgi:hypothetical protein